MKKIIIISIVSAVLVITSSCNKTTKTEPLRNEIVTSKKIVIPKTNQDTTLLTKIGSRNLSFKFIVDTSGYVLENIIVKSNSKIVQSILANKSIEFKEFSFIDWNFDGYKDITVLYNRGSGGSAYWIWNYDKRTKKFIYDSKLSEVLGLENDSVYKKVVLNYREGAIK